MNSGTSKKRSLHGAHAIVTGGARGIGYATALRLLGKGAKLSIWDRDEGALKDAESSLRESFPGASIRAVKADVTKRDELEEGLAESRRSHGPVDILINNAGFVAPGAFHEQPIEAWDTTIDVNVTALIRLTRMVIEEMYERRRGHVVNISSAAGAIGVPGLAAYSSAKWAVWGFSEALRGEALRHGVMVSSIHPGYVAEGMFGGAKLRGLGALLVPRLASHDVVARAIVESALLRRRFSPKRPRSIRLAVLLRGLLPDSWFNGLMKLLGVWDSMSTWHGRRP